MAISMTILFIFVEWSGTILFVIFMFFCVLVSYRNEIMFCIPKKFGIVFPCFGANKEILSHVTYVIITLWPKFIYINVISTYHVIEI